MEKEIQRARRLFRPGDDPVCRFRFVADHRHAYGVKRLCRVLGVSRSGFYAFLNRAPAPRQVADAALSTRITEIYEQSRRTYGAPRVHAVLSRLGVRCGRKRVTRLMRLQHQVGVHARRRWRTARSVAVHCAEERVGFRGDGGILMNPAPADPLPDVATYRPNDTGGERDCDPEDDRERDLRHVTSPVAL